MDCWTFNSAPMQEENITLWISLKSEESLLVLLYWGRRLVSINIQQVPPKLTIPWLIASVKTNIEENSKILEAHQVKRDNWFGIIIELLIKVTQRDVDLIPDQTLLPGISIIPVRAYGIKVKCNVCFSINYLEAFCPPHYTRNGRQNSSDNISSAINIIISVRDTANTHNHIARAFFLNTFRCGVGGAHRWIVGPEGRVEILKLKNGKESQKDKHKDKQQQSSYTQEVEGEKNQNDKTKCAQNKLHRQTQL